MSAPVAVAMSGGLDSSVAAWLLSREGIPVVGLSMLLWERSQPRTANGRCCGALDLGDARRVAAQCGIPHYTLHMAEEFRRQVVDPFVEETLAGRTPIACTRCNTWIKFDRLLSRARTFGAERVATGHYARILPGADGPELHAAVDAAKDQSYYLFELSREQLAAAQFPLGEMTKSDVRGLARTAGLVVAEKGESMELCFVAGTVGDFVVAEAAARPERFAAATAEASELVDSDGHLLGEGAPYYRYTVGQRRGLGLAAPERLYVLGVDAEKNRVRVGTQRELAVAGLEGDGARWTGTRPAAPFDAVVKIRARHAGVASRVCPLAGERVAVDFSEPQFGVAPGQAAVFYQGTRVVGGCWIEKQLE
jgi:tRNA-specific 2-thiouridylase